MSMRLRAVLLAFTGTLTSYARPALDCEPGKQDECACPGAPKPCRCAGATGRVTSRVSARGHRPRLPRCALAPTPPAAAGLPTETRAGSFAEESGG